MDDVSGFLSLLFILALYLLPTIIAFSKRKKNKVAIFLTNFLLGWTVLGWIISLIWSVTND
ncbi:MAG: superinfection immunity protein [Candidatus Shapirobacteria bacterium]|jgi:hypothetical protein